MTKRVFASGVPEHTAPPVTRRTHRRQLRTTDGAMPPCPIVRCGSVGIRCGEGTMTPTRRTLTAQQRHAHSMLRLRVSCRPVIGDLLSFVNESDHLICRSRRLVGLSLPHSRAIRTRNRLRAARKGCTLVVCAPPTCNGLLMGCRAWQGIRRVHRRWRLRRERDSSVLRAWPVTGRSDRGALYVAGAHRRRLLALLVSRLPCGADRRDR